MSQQTEALNICSRCGEVNPAEIHTCTPKEALAQQAQEISSKMEPTTPTNEKYSNVEALKMAYKAEETGNLQDLVDAVSMLVDVVEALAQPAQEPFGYWHVGETEEESDFFLFEDSGDVTEYCDTCIKLYTHPAPSWQGLSDDEIGKIMQETHEGFSPDNDSWRFAHAIEAKLKEKNHG